jgi:uncharacterized protein (TIGR03083 family)
MPGQALIDHGRLLEVIGLEAELLSSAAHALPGETPVPTCPGWTVAETVRHVGSVYRVARSWLRRGHGPSRWQDTPAPGQTAEEYLREGLTALAAELERHDPGDRAATWWPADPTYGFWTRRMAHETTVHRADVELAGRTGFSPIPEDVAVDGVDEALALWFGQRLPMLGLSGTRSSTVAVTTGEHHWFTRAGPSETIAWRCSEDETRHADATVSGDAADLYLWLWGRESFLTVTTTGSLDAGSQLWALLRLATR